MADGPLLKDLCKLPGNDVCAHCGGTDPTWASISLGIMLCLKCSGLHRGLGVSISFVRSATLDQWSSEQVAMMRQGGNQAFLEACPDRDYFSEAAEMYRRRLRSQVTGEPVADISEKEKRSLEKQKKQYTSTQQQFITMEAAPDWAPDTSSKNCQLCNSKFSIVNRRHHCRNCGRLVCATCAPHSNTKPIPKFGITKPVRHCLQCYASPLARPRMSQSNAL